MKQKIQLLGVGALVLTLSCSANASLIGVTPGYPLVQFQDLTQSAIQYDPITKTLTLSASPGVIVYKALDSGTPI